MRYVIDASLMYFSFRKSAVCILCVTQALGNFALIQDRDVIKEHLMDFFSRSKSLATCKRAVCIVHRNSAFENFEFISISLQM